MDRDIDADLLSELLGARVRIMRATPAFPTADTISTDRSDEWRRKMLALGHVPNKQAHDKQRRGIDWGARRQQRKHDRPHIGTGRIAMGPDQFLPRRVT